MTLRWILTFIGLAVVLAGWISPASAEAPDYAQQVVPILQKYCTVCHEGEEAEGELVLADFDKLMQGGENGPVVVPGKAEKSRLILVLEMKIEPFMPPEDNPQPTADEIAVLKAWIRSGAKGPTGDAPGPRPLVTQRIQPVGDVRRPINAVAFAPNGKWIAVARHGEIEILSAVDRRLIQRLQGHTGHVNDITFSSNGQTLLAAAGEPGLFGEASLWETADWSRRLTLKGHRDSLYAVAQSSDGQLLATSGYGQKIKLWDAGGGDELRELGGHNGPVFDLAFHPSGKVLASASGDRTVKLWDVETGRRLDTLNQPTKAQYSVAFSPDGRLVAAGGVDRRIRVWEIGQMGRAGTNPLRFARFGHEAAILRVCYSPDGRFLISSSEDNTVKVWETSDYTQLRSLKEQSDWVCALDVDPNSSSLLVGRLDGTLTSYPLRARAEAAADQPTAFGESAVPASAAGADASEQWNELTEAEPNDLPTEATPFSVPGVIQGVLFAGEKTPEDADIFRFDAKAGEIWVLETTAARDKSPADTKIEILDAEGNQIERLLLHAVRDSYVTFRPINSSQDGARLKNWEEMALNQYLYMDGEVCKIFQMPRGPDSAVVFYTGKGSRRNYFDTSGIAHAKEDPAYIVEPYAPGTKLVDNGLPVFPVHYVNDDDGERETGRDSRLTFTVPSDGSYLARVRDVRGFGGEKYKYSLTIRRPKPDFKVTIEGKDATVGAGSGQELTFVLDRIDRFSGEVRLDVNGLPPGFHVASPIVVEAGHLKANGVINVAADVKPSPPEEKVDKKADESTEKDPSDKAAQATDESGTPAGQDWSNVSVAATAVIQGETVQKQIGGLGTVKVKRKPKYLVTLHPDHPSEASPGSSREEGIMIAPGTTITAMVRVERNGFKGELRFEVMNLPHGVIVDNIGLSGVMVREGETERKIFLTAADWVPESTRHIYAIPKGDGREASWPIPLQVRRLREVAEAKP
jgi:WD40 repeat protein